MSDDDGEELTLPDLPQPTSPRNSGGGGGTNCDDADVLAALLSLSSLDDVLNAPADREPLAPPGYAEWARASGDATAAHSRALEALLQAGRAGGGSAGRGGAGDDGGGDADDSAPIPLVLDASGLPAELRRGAGQRFDAEGLLGAMRAGLQRAAQSASGDGSTKPDGAQHSGEMELDDGGDDAAFAAAAGAASAAEGGGVEDSQAVLAALAERLRRRRADDDAAAYRELWAAVHGSNGGVRDSTGPVADVGGSSSSGGAGIGGASIGGVGVGGGVGGAPAAVAVDEGDKGIGSGRKRGRDEEGGGDGSVA